MIQCRVCGKLLRDEAKFCGKCGAKLEDKSIEDNLRPEAADLAGSRATAADPSLIATTLTNGAATAAVMEPETPRCQKCNKILLADSTTCWACGSPLTTPMLSPARVPVISEIAQTGARQSPQQRLRTPPIIWVGAALLIVLAAIGAIWWASGSLERTFNDAIARGKFVGNDGDSGYELFQQAIREKGTGSSTVSNMKAKASGPVRAKIEDYFRRWHEDSDLGEGVRWVDLKKLTSFMLELSPGDSQIFSYFKFAEGQNELLSSHFAEAERHFRSALESQPNWPIAMNGIARACLRQRNYPCAEEFYRKAIQADPQWIFPHQNLGGLYMELNRLEESEREYRTAIQVNPNRAGSHYLIAQLYQRQKRLPEACVALKAALVLVGNQDRPPFDLALANRQLQRVCR